MMAGTNLRRIRTFCLKALATPRTRGAIPNCRSTPYSNTPSLRVTGFEDQDEDENEAPEVSFG
jgi:hypothetical protein